MSRFNAPYGYKTVHHIRSTRHCQLQPLCYQLTTLLAYQHSNRKLYWAPRKSTTLWTSQIFMNSILKL